MATLRMTCKHVDSNPCMDDVAGAARMDHWRCTITNGRKRMSVTFSMGIGYNCREPELSDVLESLFLDASGYEGSNGFADWADSLGMDADSIRAERTYRAVERETKALRRLLGDEFEAVAKEYEDR